MKMASIFMMVKSNFQLNDDYDECVRVLVCVCADVPFSTIFTSGSQLPNITEHT